MTQEKSFHTLLTGRVPHGAAARLASYASLVEKWRARHNLVCFHSREEFVERHVVEALAPLPYMHENGRLLDVGSGAGLPGIPLLCACPEWKGTLLEPRQKRWAFLKMAVRELGLEAEVVRERYSLWSGEKVDLVTARAVGGHEALLGWARSRLTAGGAVALWVTDVEEAQFREFPGWRVLSSPLTSLDRGRLIRFQVCST